MDSARQPGSRRDLYLAHPQHSAPIQTDEETKGPELAPLSSTGFPATRSAAVPLWLTRLWVVIRVAFFIELGMVLVVLPWTRGWTENSLLAAYPEVRFFLQKYFVRGLISGLGILDIGFGILEALHYKEPPRNPKLS